MKRIFRIYLIIQALTMLILCGCKGGNDKKRDSVSIEITENTTTSYKTASIDDNTTLDEDSQYDNPLTEYIPKDGGIFRFEELEKHLEGCPRWDDEIFSKNDLKKKIESFDEACEYAKDILTRCKKVFLGHDWNDYIVKKIQRDDENNLWVAYLMPEAIEIDGVVVLCGNHVAVFEDYGEIIGIWYEGS